ncbi:MAG: DUF1552 domain-containing protein [Planctomycetota bacterium]
MSRISADGMSRRTVLRGLGTALALPLLEAMTPVHSRVAQAAADATGAPAAPLRMAFMYVPNGMHMPDWTPATEGADYSLPRILEPLAELRGDFNILTGLSQLKANANGDGPGDHARALATFLTGTQARKTFGADIRAGVSVDQVAARHVGRQTRFASIEIGGDAGGQSGNCDSGYSCAYSANIAWRNEQQPIPKETNPKLIFDRLFSNGREGESAEARAKRERYNQSVLDLVRDDAQRLNQNLGASDRRKLDEYLSAVRELEQRIAKAQRASSDPAVASYVKPSGVPGSYEDHLRILSDLLVLSFQTDTTRVATFVHANEGSNRSYAFMNVPEGHHDLSHHGRDKGKQEKISQINRFHATQLAYLLKKLKEAKEGERSLLDNCMIVYGSGIGDGDAHNHDNLPIMLAGKAGGRLQTGRHLKFPNGTPLTNLYLSMLDWMSVPCDKLGDSSGRLTV